MMLAYFLTYQMGLSRGVVNPLLFFGYVVMLAFLLNDLPETRREWLRKAVEIALFWCATQLGSSIYFALFGESYLNQAQQLLAVMLYAVFWSRFSINRRIVIGGAGWASEMLIISIQGSTGLAYDAWYSVAALLLAMFLCALFLRHFAVEEFSLAPTHYSAVIVVQALCGMIASGNWGNVPAASVYLLVTDAVLLATLFIVYALLYYMNKMYHRNMELTIMEQRHRGDEDVLRLTQKNNEEMRILRHELKNHDAYIRTLLDQERFDDLRDYVSQDLSGIVHISPQADSGNAMIDTVLNQKLAVAEASGIRMEVRVAVPEQLPFAEREFGSLLANLLDNAIEACSVLEGERLIRLSIYREMDYLFIHMENPYSHQISDEQRLSLTSTKADLAAHGYGTKVIRRVAERYNGYVQYHIADGRFVSDVMLAMMGV